MPNWVLPFAGGFISCLYAIAGLAVILDWIDARRWRKRNRGSLPMVTVVKR